MFVRDRIKTISLEPVREIDKRVRQIHYPCYTGILKNCWQRSHLYVSVCPSLQTKCARKPQLGQVRLFMVFILS